MFRLAPSCQDWRAGANDCKRSSAVSWGRRQALSCHETRELIHGYVDGELDLAKCLEIEAHLNDCPNCTQAYKGIRSLGSAIGDSSLRFQPAENFENRLRSVLRKESETDPRSLKFRW